MEYGLTVLLPENVWFSLSDRTPLFLPQSGSLLKKSVTLFSLSFRYSTSNWYSCNLSNQRWFLSLNSLPVYFLWGYLIGRWSVTSLNLFPQRHGLKYVTAPTYYGQEFLAGNRIVFLVIIQGSRGTTNGLTALC